MDTRVEETKKVIAESLISLMKKKKFSSITNKNITDKAGLSHITIYRHFSRKDDIIKLFTHLESYKDIGILLYKSDMIHYLKDEFDRIFLAKAKNSNETYHYAFISGGLYNLYYYWIKNSCQETPQELANIFHNFYILKGDRD